MAVSKCAASRAVAHWLKTTLGKAFFSLQKYRNRPAKGSLPTPETLRKHGRRRRPLRYPHLPRRGPQGPRHPHPQGHHLQGRQARAAQGASRNTFFRRHLFPRYLEDSRRGTRSANGPYRAPRGCERAELDGNDSSGPSR